jgi:hypothetical protein
MQALRPCSTDAGSGSIMTIERRNVGKRLSDLVIYAPPPGGRLVYLAGQVAEDPHQGITGQVESAPTRSTFSPRPSICRT